MDILNKIKYDQNGLVAAVMQDYENGEVLMVAYMNSESLKTTLETGKAHFWSRSRQKFWMKGESSGHTQEIKEVFIDCDGDCILFKIKQNVAACHTGFRSCFYRKWDEGKLIETGEKLFNEDDVYNK
jgi:phosphoribosyl-AMP cyclohydrolase